MSEDLGYRGYVASRPFCGQRAPQHIQNIVINDYCKRNDLKFLLSATEVAMPGMYLILEQLFGESKSIDGIIFYSLFQLPERQVAREKLLVSSLERGLELHFAVEGIILRSAKDAEVIDQIFSVRQITDDPAQLDCVRYLLNCSLN